MSQLLVVTFLWTQRDHDMWHLTFRPWLGRCTKIWRLNRLLKIQPSPLDNWITNGNTYMNKRKRPAQIHLHSKRPHTITQMNDRLSLDSTITGSMKAHSEQITSLECRVYYSLNMNIARLILTLFLSTWFPTRLLRGIISRWIIQLHINKYWRVFLSIRSKAKYNERLLADDMAGTSW